MISNSSSAFETLISETIAYLRSFPEEKNSDNLHKACTNSEVSISVVLSRAAEEFKFFC